MRRMFQCIDHSGQRIEDLFCDSASLRSGTRSCFTSRSCHTWSWNADGSNGFPSLVARNLERKNYFLEGNCERLCLETTL